MTDFLSPVFEALAAEPSRLLDLLVRGARVIDPASGLDETADVWVVAGRVQRIAPRLDLPAERIEETRVVDGAGLWLVPGFFDMHVHLREPGEEYKETIATGTASAVSGGYAAVACMPNTNPVNDCAPVTEFILKRAEQTGSCTVFPVGAISKGLWGKELSEFGELRAAGAVAVTDDGRPVTDGRLMRRALEYARRFDLVVISHAEDLSLSEGGLMNEGAMSTRLGLRGIPWVAESTMVARDLMLAKLTGSRIHIAHVSTEASIRLIREAKSRGIPVTAETAPHYFTLSDDVLSGFDPVYKVNPPLRSREDRKAVKEALADGTIDCIATDHAPHSVLEKDIEFEYAASGMIGLESAFPLVCGLVHEGVLTPGGAIAALTWNPARILDVPVGRLQEGARATFTLVDPNAEYIIDVDSFQSKSRNCPFHGRRVKGRVLLTAVEGKAAFVYRKP